MSKIRFTRIHPLPAYDGPQPVYIAHFPWAMSEPCYVRRNGKQWETAPIVTGGVAAATFTACPTSTASATRHNAAMAFDYYHMTHTCSTFGRTPNDPHHQR